MAYEPDWLVKVLDELGERDLLHARPRLSTHLLRRTRDALVAPNEYRWPRRLAFVSAATLSLSAVVLLVLRVARGRWLTGPA
ncbi:MAG: hypothetical protein WD800_05425 [Dehalococcoidia bacterium]